MFRLMTTLFSMIATTLMGSMVTALLAMGYVSLKPILLAAAAGFLLAIPVSWFVASRMTHSGLFGGREAD